MDDSEYEEENGQDGPFGLRVQDIRRMRNEQLDDYIGDAIGGLERDEAFENLSLFVEDGEIEIEIAGVAQEAPILVNLNQALEDSIINGRVDVTPLPAPDSKNRIERQQREKAKTNRSKSILRFNHVRANRYYDMVSDSYDIPADDPFEDRLNETVQWMHPTFVLSAIAPDSMNHFGGREVAIKVDPEIKGRCYTKFDQIVVIATVNASGWAIARVPGHEPGLVGVFYSRNNKTWFGPIQFTYGRSSGFETIVVVLPSVALLAVAIVATTWVLLWLTRPSVR